VTTRTQNPPELAILEQQTALVLTHLDTTQNEPHREPPFLINESETTTTMASEDGPSAAPPRTWSAT
jgi:hypothetical protein